LTRQQEVERSPGKLVEIAQSLDAENPLADLQRRRGRVHVDRGTLAYERSSNPVRIQRYSFPRIMSIEDFDSSFLVRQATGPAIVPCQFDGFNPEIHSSPEVSERHNKRKPGIMACALMRLGSGPGRTNGNLHEREGDRVVSR
jgi:hypothetical protein